MWRVLAANRQWVVDGGGAGLVGWVVIDVVRLLTISIRNDDVVVIVVPQSVCVAWLPRLSVTWPGSLVGWFVALGPWGAVFVSSLCVVVVVIRQLWPFLGQLSSFVVAVVCWAVAVVCCVVVVVWRPGLFAVVGVA